MIRHMSIAVILLFTLFAVLFAAASPAQADNTVGLKSYDPDRAFNGYTLYCPMRSTNVYLIDMYGRVVNAWPGTQTFGNGAYLLENGNLLRTCKMVTGAGGGRLQEIDWDNNVLWQFDYWGDDYLPHHDIEPLPNGNILVLSWERFTMEEAIAAGRDTLNITEDGLSPEMIVEFQPIYPDSAVIVWEWHMYDHLVQDFDSTKANYGVVEEHYELMDVNFPIGSNFNDWQHCNGIDYNPFLDQIVMSSRSMNEIYILDHSTTTAEAASHSGGNGGKGGDFLYRYGNPEAYRAGTIDDRVLFGQHDARWIEPGRLGEGNIMIFNNGFNRPEGGYSTIDVIVPPVDNEGRYPNLFPGTPFGPFGLDWVYVADPPEEFYSPFISGATRVANDNTVICEGRSGRLFEVTPEGDIVWTYVNPEGTDGAVPQGGSPNAGIVFRCIRYAPDYPGLVAQDLTPGAPLELYPITISGTSHLPLQPNHHDEVAITSEITSGYALTQVSAYVDTGDGFAELEMFDDGLHDDGAAGDDLYGAIVPPVYFGKEVDYYIYAVTDGDSVVVDPVIAPAVGYSYTVEMAPFLCGDADGDELVNITDGVYLISYIFAGGPPPNPPEAGDTNCDEIINITDAVYIINFIFNEGPAPCEDC